MLGLGIFQIASQRRSSAAKTITLDFSTGQGSEFLSLSRTSSATYTAASGLITSAHSNTARIEHDLSGNALGLLIESDATNFIKHSSDFERSEWKKYNFGTAGIAPIVSASAYSAPDGSMDAKRVDLDSVSTSGQSSLQQSIALDAGDYTLSVWMRLNDGSANANVRMRVDFSGGSNASNFEVSDQWQRFSLTSTGVPNLHSAVIAKLRPALGTSPKTTVHLWGAQIEIGNQSTSNIETSSPADRSMDIPTLTGVAGNYDVSVIDSSGNIQNYPSQKISEGYWPPLTDQVIISSMTLKPIS